MRKETSQGNIFNILKEKTKNRSLTSFDEEEKFPFDESFGDENKNDPSTPIPMNNGHVILEEEKDNDKILQEDDINLQNLQGKDILRSVNKFRYLHYKKI